MVHQQHLLKYADFARELSHPSMARANSAGDITCYTALPSSLKHSEGDTFLAVRSPGRANGGCKDVPGPQMHYAKGTPLKEKGAQGKGPTTKSSLPTLSEPSGMRLQLGDCRIWGIIARERKEDCQETK